MVDHGSRKFLSKIQKESFSYKISNFLIKEVLQHPSQKARFFYKAMPYIDTLLFSKKKQIYLQLR